MKRYLNPWLCFFGIAYCVLCCALCVVMILITDTSNPDYVTIVGVWVVLALLMILAGVLCMPRWGVYIKISEDAVIYKQPFGKKKVALISTYKYVYKAYYSYWGWKRNFIVISQHPLNKQQLAHINRIRTSTKLIKVKYTRRNLKFLRKVFPKKLLSKLED